MKDCKFSSLCRIDNFSGSNARHPVAYHSAIDRRAILTAEKQSPPAEALTAR